MKCNFCAYGKDAFYLQCLAGCASSVNAQCLEDFYIHSTPAGGPAGYNNLDGMPNQSRKFWAMFRRHKMKAAYS